MSQRYLLDTNVLVAILRGRAAQLIERLDHESERLSVSSITVMELDYGVSRSSRPADMRHDVDGLLSLLRIEDFNRAAARQAGVIRADLAIRGLTIGPYGSLIAGHALALDFTLVTHNLSEFQRVEGLRVEDWLS